MSDNKIRLNLSKENEATKYSAEQLLQRDAYLKTYEHMNLALRGYKDFLDKEKGKTPYIEDIRKHNTILIGGERGSGKTNLLLNLETNFDTMPEAIKINRSKFHFFRLIDPTLLTETSGIQSCESFLAVITGLIHKDVEKELQGVRQKEMERVYYDVFRKLSEALESLENGKNSIGIDGIYDRQSALELEENMHLYLKVVSEIFNESLLIIRLDDIDMAFSCGFNVLETMRKYFSSPCILCIISGSPDLYEQMLSKHFSSELACPALPETNNGSSNMELLTKTQKIVNLYLEKAVPCNKRVSLDNVAEIIAKNDISINGQSTGQIGEKEQELLFHGIRNPYKRYLNNVIFNYQKYPFVEATDSLRFWFQYQTMLYHLFSDRATETKEQWFDLYCDFQKNISQMLQGNPQKKRQEIIATLNVQACRRDKTFHHEVILQRYGRAGQDNPDFIPYEPLYVQGKPNQYITIKKTSLPKDNTQKSCRTNDERNLDASCSSLEKFILKLFVSDNALYNSSQNFWIVFTGRFVEYLFSTLNTNSEQDQAIQDQILNEAPLFANMTWQMNTVPLEFLSIDQNEVNEILRNPRNRRFDQSLFADANFLSLTMVQYFNNLNAVQQRLKTESLLSYIRRCILILLNATAILETDHAAQQNIAINRNFSLDSLKRSDHAYSYNIKKLINNNSQSITQALYWQPLVQIILGEGGQEQYPLDTLEAIKLQKTGLDLGEILASIRTLQQKLLSAPDAAQFLATIQEWASVDPEGLEEAFDVKLTGSLLKKSMLLYKDMDELDREIFHNLTKMKPIHFTKKQI